jgi:PEP-CTERM motif
MKFISLLASSRSAGLLAIAGIFLFSAGIVVHQPKAHASIIIVAPNENESTAGNSNNNFPFNISCCSTTGMRYQQMYDSSVFGGTSGVISEIAFRLDEEIFTGGLPSSPSVFSTSLDIEVRLSHTALTPDTMSGVFLNNIGSNETLVLDNSNYIFEGDGTFAFSSILDVKDLFNYNGTDNLLLDLKIFNNPSTSVFDAVGFPFGGSGALIASASAKNFNATETDSGTFEAGLVTQFTFLMPATPMPEPSTIAIFGLGLAGMVFWRRRRKQQEFTLRLQTGLSATNSSISGRQEPQTQAT